jgi:hypothetical protein
MKKLIHSEKGYGPDYKAHLLSQYQIYCEALENATSRRQELNRLFILLNTGIFTIIGILLQQGNSKSLFISLLPVVIIGFFVCYLQWKFLGMYKELITAKFNVIYEIEKSLPLGLYIQEWEQINSRNNKYKSFSEIEKQIPLIFSAIYLFIFLLISVQAYYP